MFDKSYQFNKIGPKTPHSSHIVSIDLYRFSTTKRKYLCEVERYEQNIFILKFYLREDKNLPNRYKRMTGDGNTSKIVCTCLNILINIYKKNPTASFGFIGSAMEGEGSNITKRFLLYSKVAYNKFGSSSFEHIESQSHSLYFLASRSNPDIALFIEKSKELFCHVYPELIFEPIS